MALLKRVRHVLGTEPDGASRADRWSAGLIALAVPPALWLAVSVLAPPVVGQEERERGVRERERPESPEARERERERESRPARGRDYGFGPEFEQAFREAQLRRGMTRLYTDPEELEQTIREAQRQAREAEARAKEARHRAEEMMRRMMPRRDERMRPGDEREEDARERGADRPGPEEFREMIERRMRLRAEGFGTDGPPVFGLAEELRRLREEVGQLRREVEEMREGPRRGPFDGEDRMPGMMRRMRETRDPFGVRPPSPPSPPERPRMERDRGRERDEESERDRERRDEDVSARFRIRRPDRPLPPFGPPEAPRSRIERDEQRDRGRHEEPGELERDESTTVQEREESRQPESETLLLTLPIPEMLTSLRQRRGEQESGTKEPPIEPAEQPHGEKEMGEPRSDEPHRDEEGASRGRASITAMVVVRDGKPTIIVGDHEVSLERSGELLKRSADALQNEENAADGTLLVMDIDDRLVPSEVISQVIEQAKAAGFARVAFASREGTGKPASEAVSAPAAQ